ncbi:MULTISPECIES: hypothetical protein [unclassified Cyanobium]|uniref:hypothetical protein n=1 Tax=unclassified Cyanobium TaxID=2627006 RepID=UPI0020CB774C|nr:MULTISPECIES: hypothetical protein [unclassified Cyanobium]MCP9857833.1 hypothetical protein [Cyanobium sp. Cruz-8H5]MCP9865110.1 hypothetical protein [Cyanobium sp. Cruz-8D1]
MSYLLQFCGLSDPLQLFYLEQKSASPASGHPTPGPIYGGFRPFQLDDLLGWALDTAGGRSWDGEAIQRLVLDVWMERADVIRQWQLRLREEPAERMLVAGIGTQRDWEFRCEQLLKG